jgi:hypothetical protein
VVGGGGRCAAWPVVKQKQGGYCLGLHGFDFARSSYPPGAALRPTWQGADGSGPAAAAAAPPPPCAVDSAQKRDTHPHVFPIPRPFINKFDPRCAEGKRP